MGSSKWQTMWPSVVDIQGQGVARNTVVSGFACALGALVIGYIGEVIKIFQVSLVACATVGLTWPILLSELLKKKEEVQKPTEET